MNEGVQIERERDIDLITVFYTFALLNTIYNRLVSFFENESIHLHFFLRFYLQLNCSG